MSTTGATFSSREIERIRAAAQLPVAMGPCETIEQLGRRACELARSLLAAEAATFYLGCEPPRVIATLGFALEPPEDLPHSLALAELERLRHWANRSGFGRLELVPIQLDRHPAGLFALFIRDKEVPALEQVDLELLGAALSCHLGYVRTTSELVRACARKDQEHDRRVRAERMRALGEMALGIAHDFNNVLNAIQSHVGLLSMLGRGQPRIEEALERLRRITQGGATTVGRLQEFSRQRRDQDFSEIDLHDVLLEASTAVAARAATRPGEPIRVVTKSDDGVRIRGDRTELVEALRALGDNAVDATMSGQEVKIDLVSTEGEAQIIVADSGPGMSRDVCRRAFDPFFTTKGSGSKGLGLSIAFGIIGRHGGRIEIDSTLGKGTRVNVRLPVLSQEAQTSLPSAPRPARPHTASSTRSVLLVEDDPDNRDALSALLQMSGFRVTAADSGAAGVKAFRGAEFDLVLTDLGLPDIDGWQVAGEVKASDPKTPVALITGWGFNLDRTEIRRRGVDLLVKKPIDPARFLGQIENLVG
jgi:signal transduction histidine kinase